MKLFVIHGDDRFDVTDRALSVQWSGAKENCCRELAFSLLADPSGRIKSVPCEIIDRVMLYEGRTQLFTGEVWRRVKASTGGKIDFTCFDIGYRLKKITAFEKFEKQTPLQILKSVCAKYGIAIGAAADPDVKITRIFQGVSLYKIIQTAYTLAGDKTDQRYQIVFDRDRLNVTLRGAWDRSYVLTKDANIIEDSITESAENIVTRIKIYSQDGKFVTNVNNDAAAAKYGVLQEIVKQTEDDNKIAAAKQLLKEGKLSQKISMEAIGDTRCRTGSAVVVCEPHTGVNGMFFIDADAHIWKNGTYTNKMTLSFENLMEEIEAGGDNDGFADTLRYKKGGGGKKPEEEEQATIIDKVLAYIKDKIDRGCKYSKARRMEEGYYDCSSLIFRAFRDCGALLTRSDGKQVNATAAYLIEAKQLKYIYEPPAYGKSRGNVPWDKLRPGDLIFYSFQTNSRPYNISHVAIVYSKFKIAHARNVSFGIGYNDITWGRGSVVCIMRYKFA